MVTDDDLLGPVSRALARIAGPEAPIPAELRNSPNDTLRDPGWHRLRAAVLVNALDDYRRASYRSEIIDWLCGPYDGPCAFEAICACLGLDPGFWRVKFLRFFILLDNGIRPERRNRGPAGRARRQKPQPRRAPGRNVTIMNP